MNINSLNDISSIDDENIIYKSKVSKILFVIPVFFSLFILFLIIIKSDLVFIITSLIFNMLLFLYIKFYLDKSFIYLTKSKLHYYFGIIPNNSDLVFLNKINKITVQQSIFEMIFNIGNVIIVDNSGERQTFYFIKKPNELKSIFSKTIN